MAPLPLASFLSSLIMLSSGTMKPLKNRKPGQQLAFLPYPDIEPLAETMLAFANNSGGLIVLGRWSFKELFSIGNTGSCLVEIGHV